MEFLKNSMSPDCQTRISTFSSMIPVRKVDGFSFVLYLLAVLNLKLHRCRHSNIYPVKSILRVTSFVPRTVARSRSQPWFVFVFLEHRLPKGGLISESISLCPKSSKKRWHITPLFMVKCSGGDLALNFGYLSQMYASCHFDGLSSFEIGIKC